MASASDRFEVEIPEDLLIALARVHPRFKKKALEWAESIKSVGLIETQRMRGDHPLHSRSGESREGLWATRLNHRYRLFYRRDGSVVRAVRIDDHSRMFY